jgi:AcrR family transcriptional regulator
MPDHAVSALEVDRRSQILDCACRVIARGGVDGLRMAGVAREAGVSSALLHYYFATREELVRLAFERHDHRETERSHARLAEIDDPIARLRDVLAHELSEDEAVLEGWVIWGELERYALFHEEFRAAVADRSNRWVGMVAELVGEAQDAGRVDPEIDAVSAGLRLTGVVDSLGSHLMLGTIERAEALREVDASLRDILHLGTRWGR